MRLYRRLSGCRRATLGAVASTLAGYSLHAGGEPPLAMIDFASGVVRHMEVVGPRPDRVDLDGQTFLQLSPPRVSQPMEWSADMPDPGFPGVNDPGARRVEVDQPALILAVTGVPDVGNRPVACLLTVYDITESPSGNCAIRVSWPASQTTRPGRFQLSGNPYTKDPLTRPKIVRKMVLAEHMLIDNSLDGGSLKIEAPTTLYLKRVELFLLPAWADAAAAIVRPPALAAHGAYAVSESVLDLWLQDMSDLMVDQTQTYAERVESEDAARTLLRLMDRFPRADRALPAAAGLEKDLRALAAVVEASALAADRYYYEGRAALVSSDWRAYMDVLRETVAALDTVRIASRRLADKAGGGLQLLRKHPAVFAGEPEPVPGDRPARKGLPSVHERVLFSTFANSRWEGRDPFNAYGRYLAILGIDTKTYLGGSIRVEADGSPRAADVASHRDRLRYLRARGWNVVQAVGHHEHHVTAREWAPAWLRKQSADSLMDVDYDGTERSPRWNLWNPDAADYFHHSIGALARESKGRPAVRSMFCWTELMCGTGYSRSARAAFRSYLAEKYKDTETLNRLWGTAYASFDQVEPPPPPGEALREKASGLTYEFEKFRRDSFTHWWREADRRLKAEDPEAMLWLEGWGRYDYLLKHGMDQLALFDAADLAAVHTGSMGQDAQRIWQLALSKYSGTPIADGEINIYGPYYAGFADMEQLRAAGEQHVLLQTFYGVRAFIFWASQLSMYRAYSYGGPYLYDTTMVSPVSSSGAALRIVRRKGDLYDSIIRRTEAQDPEVGVLFSSTSFINSWPYNEVEHEMLPIHAWFYHSDYGYRVVHEDAITDGREDLYSLRVLIAPWAMWLKPDAATALAEWVRKGGVLISSGPAGAFDPYGRPLNTVMEAAFGKMGVAYGGHERSGDNRLDPASVARLRAVGDYMTTHFGGWFWDVSMEAPASGASPMLSLEDGTPVVYAGQAGAGRVVMATGPLGKNGLRQWVLNEVANRVRPLVRKTIDDGFHVLPRRDAYGHLYLAVVNQSVDRTVTDTLRVDGRYQQVRERTLYGDWCVPAAFDGAATVLTLRLVPGEGTVLILGAPAPADSRLYTLRPDAPPPPAVAAPRPWSYAEWETSRATVQGRPADADVKAEALALLNASLRAGSLGYDQRAAALREAALTLKRFEKPFVYPGDRVEAAKASAPVAIDGDAAEWRGTPRHAVKGTPSSGGAFAFQWDETNLYVLLIARDETLRHVEELGGDVNWVWNYDGLLLTLNAADAAPLTVGGALHDAKYRAGQSALMVSITGRKYATSAAGVSAAGIRSAAKAVPGGYVMEVAIPLRDVMVPALAGAEAGFNVYISDNGRRNGFAFFSDREGWAGNPLIFARMVLMGNEP